MSIYGKKEDASKVISFGFEVLDDSHTGLRYALAAPERGLDTRPDCLLLFTDAHQLCLLDALQSETSRSSSTDPSKNWLTARQSSARSIKLSTASNAPPVPMR